MEFRSDVFSSYGSSVPISADEISQKLPTLLTQKVKMISCDVSDISQISDIASEPNNDVGSMNYNLSNNPNIYQSASWLFQKQSTPLSAVTMTDQTVPKQMTAPKLQQQLKSPIIGPSHCTSVMEIDKSPKLELAQCADLSVPIFWECLKRQEEKVNTLQEQISRILDQKAVPCLPDPKLALVPNNGGLAHNPSELIVSQQTILKDTSISSPRSSFGEECNENSQLLSCLQAQNEQIRKLQEQNHKLLEQNIKLLEEKQTLQVWNQELKCKLLLKNDRKSMKKLTEKASLTPPREQSLIGKETRCTLEEINGQNSPNTAYQQQTEPKRVYQSTKPKSIDAGSVEFREEKEIEKTSTSTMTSLIYDGSDKVVYQKLTTVTTDFKKQRNEISTPCSPKKQMTTPENRILTKGAASSSRKKKGKCRKCGKCSPLYTGGKAKSAHADTLDASKNICRNMQQISPESGEETQRDALQICEEKIKENPDRIIFPRYENILRNVNELNLNCNEVETTPRLKPALIPSSKERKKYTIPPRAIELSPTIENRRQSNRKKSSSTASNTSTDSLSTSPNCSIQEVPYTESDTIIPAARTISIYGLSSPNLSKDTRRYLENFGLVRDRNEDSLKYNESRTTLVKRYLR